jgi:hypothetical protein
VVYAVTGLRGTGKTQLAAACARERIAAGWRLVAWVNAETTATLLDGPAAAAAALGVAPAGDLPGTARALRHRLETGGRHCLIVLDNAPGPGELRPWLPAAGDAQVIITSTRRDTAGHDCDAGPRRRPRSRTHGWHFAVAVTAGQVLRTPWLIPRSTES